MTKLIAISALVPFACCALVGSAGAQIVMGQEFYAAPMSHGGLTMGRAQIVQPAPPPAPVVAAPPEPAPVKKKHRVRHTAK